ncbi:MAG: class II aldolase/adducin family protein [Gammaproteobacteria bacterium]|nr:class II aldolase/adducin family protein [Gammaproteobacteria bacterium]
MSEELKSELIQIYRWLRQYGLNDSHSGNISARYDDKYYITPTGACADTLQTDQLIECKLNNTPVNSASLDAPLHQLCYEKNPSIKAVVHSHGPYTVGLSMDLESYTPSDFEGQYYFPSIRILTIPYADYVKKAPEMVSDTLQTDKIVVVRGHGIYAAAESLELAYKWTCSLEQSAKTDVIRRMSK